MTNEFLNKLHSTLEQVDPELLRYSEIENIAYERSYKTIDDYAKENNLINTCISVELLRGLLASNNEKSHFFKGSYVNRLNQYWHALDVAIMLMALKLPISKEDEDVLLSVALLHVLEKLDIRSELKLIVEEKCFLDPKIFYILNICKHNKYQSTKERIAYYANIQNDPLALLFKLADRGCYISRLYELPAGKASEYVSDTKIYFLPLAIHGKEKYPELLGPISIMLEKLRCLSDVADLITKKYELIHEELNREILEYLEDNYRLRNRIKHIKES